MLSFCSKTRVTSNEQGVHCWHNIFKLRELTGREYRELSDKIMTLYKVGKENSGITLIEGDTRNVLYCR